MTSGVTRQKVVELMGKEDIMITNREEMLNLQRKLEEEYQRKQIEKERHLQDLERKRIRKLMADGLIEKEPTVHHAVSYTSVHGAKHKPKQNKKCDDEVDALWGPDFRPNPSSLRRNCEPHKDNKDNEADKDEDEEEIPVDNYSDDDFDATESKETFEPETTKTSMRGYSRVFSPTLDELIHEETVSGLYDKAAQIIALS